MAEQKQLLQIIDDFSFSKLIGAFKLAISPARFVIVIMAVVAVCLIGWILDICSMPGSQTVGELATKTGQISPGALPEVYPTDPLKTMDSIEQFKHSPPKGVFSTLWNFCASRFNTATVALIQADITTVFANIWLSVVAVFWAFKYHTVYSVIFLLSAGPVICVASGAVCRSAALEFARGEKPGLLETITFSGTNIRHLLTGPLLTGGIILLLAFFVILPGLIGNLPWKLGELVIGLSFPVALLFGLLTATMLIGSFAGLGLLFPVIAFEVSDGFDAVSRAISYVFIQPWRMILYTLIATIHGTIAYLIVRAMAFLLLIVTYLLLDFGIFTGENKLAAIWPKPHFRDLLGTGSGLTLNWLQKISTFIIHLNVLLIITVVVAFVISFYLCANTIIYALLRKKVDNTPVNEIHISLDGISGPAAD